MDSWMALPEASGKAGAFQTPELNQRYRRPLQQCSVGERVNYFVASFAGLVAWPAKEFSSADSRAGETVAVRTTRSCF